MTTPTAYSGRAVLLQLGTTSPVTIATARINGFTINHTVVDTTTKLDSGWGALLSGGGVKELTITLDGIFENQAYDKTIRGYGFDGTSNPYTLVTGNGDIFTGNFVITSYAVGGDYSQAETFSISLRNDGPVTYTPAP